MLIGGAAGWLLHEAVVSAVPCFDPLNAQKRHLKRFQFYSMINSKYIFF
jgi:hypothetical protein